MSHSHLQGILSTCRVIQGGASKFELYNDNVDSTLWMKAKVPDLSLEVTIDGVKESESPYPTIVVEVGYSQAYENLLGDIEAWLLGSLGHIKCGILVNWRSLQVMATLVILPDGKALSKYGIVPSERSRHSKSQRLYMLMMVSTEAKQFSMGNELRSFLRTTLFPNLFSQLHISSPLVSSHSGPS